ncbi:MAG: hypothetical protein C5B58_05455 [Acidobacteria bacterium]|nr:MAG: hypothetical protein C5B58_05455 [Acidobacteriota bacterium]
MRRAQPGFIFFAAGIQRTNRCGSAKNAFRSRSEPLACAAPRGRANRDTNRGHPTPICGSSDPHDSDGTPRRNAVTLGMGVLPVSLSDEIDRTLLARVNEARELYALEPTHQNCEARNRAFRQFADWVLRGRLPDDPQSTPCHDFD